MGKIFLLMGKSASGKDAIYRNLLKDETLSLDKVVMYTTRPMRQGEEDGRQYFFVNESVYRLKDREGKIIEAREYHTKLGLWRYFTVDDGQIVLKKNNYLMIGTLDTLKSLRDYFGASAIAPLYIDADDGLRLERALKRERRQEHPRYDEMCRRYLADDRDFAKERLKDLNVKDIFTNNDELEDCLKRVADYIRKHG